MFLLDTWSTGLVQLMHSFGSRPDTLLRLIDRSDRILLKLLFNRKNLPVDLSVTLKFSTEQLLAESFLKRCAQVI